jgi:hypothetical protein
MMRRPRAGIRWLVTHRYPTGGDDDALRTAGRVSGRSRSSWQASSCSAFLTCRRPTARQPAGPQTSSSDRKVICGKAPASRKPGLASSRSGTGDPALTALALAARHAVESSIGSVISTRSVSGRRPRAARRRPARQTTHANVPDRPASCRGQPRLPSGLKLISRRSGGHGCLFRSPSQSVGGFRAWCPARVPAGSEPPIYY